MFLAFVDHTFFLDLAALIHSVHCTENAPAFRDALEFLVDRLFDKLSEFVDDERPLPWVFAEIEAKLPGNNHLDRDGTTHRLFSGCRNRLVERIGMQAVAVVEQCIQSLQCRSNVIETDFLCVQAASRGLHMVLEHLRSSLGPVTLAHGSCPDTPRNATDHRVLWVHAVGEKETQMRCKLVNFHAPREIVLNNCKPIGQRERELADRVRTSFCDVISANRNAVIIAHAVINEELLYVAHHFHCEFSREDAGILRLVFLENVSLYRAADRRERLFADARKGICIDYLVTGYAQQAQSQTIVSRW